MQVVVFGGGCWGHHHASGLLKAKAAGRASFDRLLVVDRLEEHRVRGALGDRPDVSFDVSEWSDFLREYIGSPAMEAGDLLVPAPIAPHLFMDWLALALTETNPAYAWTPTGLEEPVGTPFESTGPNGERFVSFADWMCPPNCLEPKRCPAIRAPRTWEMPETMADYGQRIGTVGAAIFHSRHYAWGIAALPAADLVQARNRLSEAIARNGGGEVLVATVSACHGVVGRLSATPKPQGG